VLIYSLRANDPGNQLNTHHVLTPEVLERDTLIGSGAWEQVCNVGWAPPGLCYRSDNLTGDGPFMLFAQDAPGRLALWRCWSGVANFFSTDPNCEGREVVRQLGYLSQSRTSSSPRPFNRCYSAAGQVHFHWLGESCPVGFQDAGVLGYVR
jgi:hypothetical protein